jgi:hypothetical protein
VISITIDKLDDKNDAYYTVVHTYKGKEHRIERHVKWSCLKVAILGDIAESFFNNTTGPKYPKRQKNHFKFAEKRYGTYIDYAMAKFCESLHPEWEGLGKFISRHKYYRKDNFMSKLPLYNKWFVVDIMKSINLLVIANLCDTISAKSGDDLIDMNFRANKLNKTARKIIKEKKYLLLSYGYTALNNASLDMNRTQLFMLMEGMPASHIRNTSLKDLRKAMRLFKKYNPHIGASLRSRGGLLSFVSYAHYNPMIRDMNVGPNVAIHNLVIMNERWHREIHQRNLEKKLSEAGVDVPFPPSKYSRIPEGFTRLTTPRELILEGSDMKHCVAGYASYCREGYEIYAVNYRGERATICINPDGSIQQSRGPSNNANKASKYAIEAWNNLHKVAEKRMVAVAV